MPFDFSSKNAPKSKPQIDSSGLLPRESRGSSPSPLGGESGKSSGFQNKPERKATTSPVPAYTGQQSNPRVRPARPHVGRSAPLSVQNLPWAKILPILGIISVIVLCFVFRDVITAFIAQVAAWVIVVLILFLIVKHMFFGK